MRTTMTKREKREKVKATLPREEKEEMPKKKMMSEYN